MVELLEQPLKRCIRAVHIVHLFKNDRARIGTQSYQTGVALRVDVAGEGAGIRDFNWKYDVC